MDNSQRDNTFDKIYGQTYNKTLHYITARCGDAGDIPDIMQDVYAELYRVLSSRGDSYIREPEAFVMQLAKSKVYRYYSLRKKIRRFLPLAPRSSGEEDSWNEEDFSTSEDTALDELVADRILLQNIASHIKTKPNDVQKIFYLYYALEQTTAQIAQALHINESTVKSKIHRTVCEVRGLYGKVGKE